MNNSFSITDQSVILSRKENNSFDILNYDTKEKIGSASFDLNNKNNIISFNLSEKFNNIKIKKQVAVLLNYVIKGNISSHILLEYEKNSGKLINDDDVIKYSDKDLKDKYLIIYY